jgi:O-antigen/teichoic acid export membrane protein
MLAIQSPFEMLCEHARSQIQPWKFMWMQLVCAFFSTVLGAALIVLGFGWWGPLIGLTVGMLIPAVYAYSQDWRGLRLSIDPEAFKIICQYGLPLSVTVAFTIVISNSDRFLIAGILGKDAAGLYSVAVDFTSRTLTLLMMVIYLAVFPLAVRAWEERGREAAQEQMRHNASLLLAVGLPAVAGMSILSPGIAHCFLGKDFQVAASHVLPLVAIGTFLASFKACHFDTAFQFVNRTIIQVWIVLVAAVFNVALNLATVRHYGINGAAMSSVLAYILSIVLTAVVGRRFLSLPLPMGPLLQTAAAALAMGLVIAPFRHHISPVALGAQIMAGIAVYGVLLLAFDFLGMRTAWMRKRDTFRAVTANPDVPAASADQLQPTGVA